MSPSNLHFLIVDDNKLNAEMHKDILNQAGFRVTIITSSKDALFQVPFLNPDVILSDLLMPELDGLELFHSVKKLTNIKQPAFIMLTGKTFDFDRRHALESGVDGYLNKPVNPDTFVNDLLEIIQKNMVIQFWGIRGTLPVPGDQTIGYGGNTNCVTLSFAKKQFFIFDAGTGIKALSNHLMKQNKFPISAKIFISHPHYDHINGLPFFAPLYMKENEFEILGPNDGDVSFDKLISGQMDSLYFPITMKEFSAKVSFKSLAEENFEIDNLQIQTLLLNHPGKCLGFRVQHKDKIFCYVTDNEICLDESSQFEVDRLIKFIYEADLIVIDSTYTDEEYLTKTGWGHSSISRVVDIADKAKVKKLCLYHHDPDQFDKDIDLKLQKAQELLESRNSLTKCIAAHEGDQIII